MCLACPDTISVLATSPSLVISWLSARGGVVGRPWLSPLASCIHVATLTCSRKSLRVSELPNLNRAGSPEKIQAASINDRDRGNLRPFRPVFSVRPPITSLSIAKQACSAKTAAGWLRCSSTMCSLHCRAHCQGHAIEHIDRLLCNLLPIARALAAYPIDFLQGRRGATPYRAIARSGLACSRLSTPTPSWGPHLSHLPKARLVSERFSTCQAYRVPRSDGRIWGSIMVSSPSHDAARLIDAQPCSAVRRVGHPHLSPANRFCLPRESNI